MIRSHRMFPVILAALALAAPPVAQSAAAAHPRAPATAPAESLDTWAATAREIIRGRVDRKWSMGIAVGVISAEGQRIVGYGRLRADSDAAPDGDTLYEIGSITKVFTGMLLADMALKKEVQLTDPLDSLLPPGTVVPAKDGKKVTLLSLAHHRSGLPRGAGEGDPLHPADFTPKDLYAWLAAWKPAAAPGEKYEYSNLGFATLGQALSLKAGVDYETAVRERLCKPLSMGDTFARIPPELKKRFAQGHDMFFRPAPGFGDTAMPGAGALSSTAKDMLKFLAASMGLTPTPIDPVIKLALSEREKSDKDNQWRGLGWHIDLMQGREFIWKNGQTAGYNAFIAFLPDQRRGVVVLSNTRSDINDIAVRLLDPSFKLDARKDKPRREHTLVTVKPEVIAPYVGQYEPDSKKTCTVTVREGHLFVQSKNLPPVELLPESDTVFVCVMPAQVTFRKDAQGKVAEFLFHNEGKDEPDVVFKKISDSTAAP
jgi:serine-type D-Ala-D-Ala carboxypeptidase/endopeptidase